MKVTILIADFAQVVGGKLYIMGGGWSITGPQAVTCALAIKVEVPWNDTNRKHQLKVELIDADYRPILVSTPVGETPVVLSGEFEVGRPPGLLPGSALDVPFAFNIGPLPLPGGRHYIWKVSIDGTSNDNWQVGFTTRPSAQPSSAAQ